MRRTTLFAVLVMLAAISEGRAEERPNGQLVIRGGLDSDQIVITTTQRLAGAIHSLQWKGKEFIDSTDHGRQLQSASNFDAGSAITAETFNPTEAGSRADGAGPNSTSRLLHAIASGNQLQTTSQMAFWLKPNEKSGANPAKNTTALSNHLLTKRVTIGFKDMPQVLLYDVTFSIPLGEHHTQAAFEVLTGYMPAEFSRFWTLDEKTGEPQPLTDGPGEQPQPVIFATESGSHAMGIWTPHEPRRNESDPGYGRWRFGPEKVVKWNCVFRVRNNEGIPAGEYAYRTFVAVGDLETVRSSLMALPSRITHDQRRAAPKED